jgi:hypothetical protein
LDAIRDYFGAKEAWRISGFRFWISDITIRT